jgi:lactoylglutathione lyase
MDMGYEVTDLSGLPGNPPGFYFVTDPDGYDIEVIRAK